MSKLKKALPLLATSLLLLTSCGTNGDGDKRILKIEFVKGGFGLTPYEKLAEAFMKEHKDVKVKLIPNREMASTTATKLEQSSNLSDIMIYNRAIGNIYDWSTKGYIYDLSDLMKEEVENGETLLDRLDDNAKKSSEYRGSYWSIPEYYNINGFVYNSTLFEAKKWNLPKTTKELKDLCETIDNTKLGGNSIKPLVYCGNGADGYLYYGIDGWMTSFEGVANMDNFYKFDSPEVYAPSVSKGKLKGMSLLKEIFFDSDYCCENSMIMNATEGQSKLLTYEAAMMLNGSWFENEMKPYMNASSPTFKMFAVPEISDDSNNVLHNDGYKTNDKNEQVVTADFVGNCFIPSAASNISDAKEFLKFMSRKSSCELYTKYSNAVRPLKYDYSSSNNAYKDMSGFGKSVLDIASNYCLYVPNSKANVAVANKATLYPQGGYWYKRMYSNPDKYTPSFCIDSDYKYAKDSWSRWIEESAYLGEIDG